MTSEGVFAALGDDGYEYCHPIDQNDFEVFNAEIDGTPKGATWRPIPVEIVRSDGPQSLLRSDAPWLGDHALIFRSEAVLALRELLRSSGELLPLSCRDTRLVVFNPAHALPALDESAASLLRFQDGRVMMVQKYAFVSHMLEGIDAFKLTNLRVSPTFVSRRFVKAWESHGLKGLKFRRVA